MSHAISVEEIFRPVVGLPCWHVRKGHGSFITFEFGEPYQTIYPVRTKKTSDSLQNQSTRCVAIYGNWRLWIHCCDWRILQAGNEIAHSESSDSGIASGCSVLDGQALSRVEVLPDEYRCRFIFDLGGVLETWPYDDLDDEQTEQWYLYCPSVVFNYKSDGSLSSEERRLSAD